MKTDPLHVGRMPVSIETISHLRNLFGARAESTLFSIELNGKPFIGSAMLRESRDGSLTLLLNPPTDDVAKWDGKFDWEAYFADQIAGAIASVAPMPLTMTMVDPPKRRRGRDAALEGGDAA